MSRSEILGSVTKKYIFCKKKSKNLFFFVFRIFQTSQMDTGAKPF